MSLMGFEVSGTIKLRELSNFAPNLAGAATFLSKDSYSDPWLNVPLRASFILGFAFPNFSIDFGTAIISTMISWVPA